MIFQVFQIGIKGGFSSDRYGDITFTVPELKSAQNRNIYSRENIFNDILEILLTATIFKHPQSQSGYIIKTASQFELREHSIDFVRWLFDIFQ